MASVASTRKTGKLVWLDTPGIEQWKPVMFPNLSVNTQAWTIMKIAIAAAKWLIGQQRATSAVPVVVQIADRTYPAVRYTESEAAIEETRLYVLGEMPPLHSQMRRVCYRADDSDYDWHLVAWFRQRTSCTEWCEVHPFGSHYILAQWSPIENWAADQCEKRPYRRLPMTITNFGGPEDASVRS